MKLKESILESDTNYELDFNEKDKLKYYDMGVMGGYRLARNNNILFTPYIYIGGTSLQNDLYRSNKKNYMIFNSFFVGPGLRTDIKLLDFKSRDNEQAIPSSLGVRVDIGYNHIMKYNFSPAKGDLLYARIVLVWRIGDFF
jgi:hypothetical protein